MFAKYVKLSFRNLAKNKALSFLMIGGLALGVAASLLLTNYIEWQWSFDRFHQDKDVIYRVNSSQNNSGEFNDLGALTYSGLPFYAHENFPEVESFTRIAPWIAKDVVLRNDEIILRNSSFYFTDPNFFETFTFKLLEGNPSSVLEKPNSIVLTSDASKALFGDEDPMGETVLFDGRNQFEVTGIAENPPVESHIQFSALSPIKTIQDWGLDVYADQSYAYPNVYSYLKLTPDAEITRLTQNLTASINNLQSNDETIDHFEFQALTDIHLNDEVRYGLGEQINGKNIWILFGVCFLILFLSGVNYINIYSSMVLDQSKSLSIRRIIGAQRKHVFNQLASSSLITILLASGLGLLISEFSRPYISQTFDLPLKSIFNFTFDPVGPFLYLILYLVIGGVLTILLPAFLLSTFNPVGNLFRSKIQLKGNNFRNALLGLQFMLIITLIGVGTVVYQQTNFMQKQDPGFNLDDLIVFRGPLGFQFEGEQDVYFDHFVDLLKNGNPDIETVSFSDQIVGNELVPIEQFSYNNKDLSYQFYRQFITKNYMDAYDLEWLYKPAIDEANTPGQRYAFINQHAANLLGFARAEDAINKKVKMFDTDLVISGVVGNHHQQSLHHPTQPIIFDYQGGLTGGEDGYFSVQVKADTDISEIIPFIQANFHQAFPFAYFEAIDIKEKYNAQYGTDNHFKYLIFGFMGIGLVIGCLGLLGLTLIAIKQRSKEVSIRKVLGAGLDNIVFLFAKDFLKIILVAMPLAFALAYYLSNSWLENFSYKVNLEWWVFGLAGCFTLIIAIATIGIQSLRAARKNPLNSLRSE